MVLFYKRKMVSVKEIKKRLWKRRERKQPLFYTIPWTIPNARDDANPCESSTHLSRLEVTENGSNYLRQAYPNKGVALPQRFERKIYMRKMDIIRGLAATRLRYSIIISLRVVWRGDDVPSNININK